MVAAAPGGTCRAACMPSRAAAEPPAGSGAAVSTLGSSAPGHRGAWGGEAQGQAQTQQQTLGEYCCENLWGLLVVAAVAAAAVVA